MSTLAGAILAGGKSSRFGRDKAELVYQGQSFLEHMRQALLGAGLAQIYISHPAHIADAHAGSGPLAGIYSVLKASHGHARHVLFVPVDMPHMTSEMILELLRAPQTHDLVTYHGHHMPLRLSNTAHIQNMLEDILSGSGNLSLGHFFDQVKARHILDHAHHPESAFSNINTPSAYEALR